MVSKGRIIVACLLTLGALTVVSSAGLLAFVRSDKGRQWIASTVSQTLSSQGSGSKGYGIRIGAMGVPGLTGVAVHDIEISDRQGGGIITLPNTRIKYNPLRLLLGASTGAVSGIELVRPEISVRRGADGAWNLELLLGSGSGKGGFLLGADADVRIVDGTINVEGLGDGTPIKGMVEGRLRFRKGRITTPGLKGWFDMGRVGLSGWMNLGSKEFKGDFGIAAADMKGIVPLLPDAWGKYVLPHGIVDAKGSFGGSLASPEVGFEAKGQGLSLHTGSDKGGPVDGDAVIKGGYKDGVVSVTEGEGLLSGGEVAFTGSYPLNGSAWRFDIAAHRADLSAVSGALGLPIGIGGEAAGGLVVEGSGGDWSIKGDLRAGKARIKGLDAHSLAFGFGYSPKGLVINRGTFMLGEGSGSIMGTIDPVKGVDLEYSGRGIELAQLALIDSRLEMSGVGDTDGRIASEPGRGLVARGGVRVKAPSYASIAGDEVEGDYTITSGGLDFGNVMAKRGNAVYTGFLSVVDIDKGDKARLEGNIAVAGETVEALASGVRKDIAGILTGIGGGERLDGRVKINGPLSSPQFSVRTRMPWGPQTTIAMKWVDGRLKLMGGSLGPSA